ncbi:hypothetical protein B9Q11_04305 [Candidatus Marsarchaeota G2 archaeon ECH_B_SAG-F08]|uniref:Zinc-ribbon domain-containing protein n=4 Tax=Candidatus Marsarchaeota TaxID=1978152 RepID=A0A2R6AHB5_9ARCH|nr:MAG: hypothetical protein B9Q01_08010 [Candidatus Marsarchaeota G1 archaeon OSP_D]PSN85738.1 MAG: hypothetical protein B9Q02_05065 [Candidatus Marsarchaeota G1 archaeon BE_D]PSN97363.1 MAG: hypothetical protein B9Q11_04305 [Candidatus Marsarchaeota G2 archaeon ECH_B_SAG-F08]PSO04376.1 MAG: hypothetical protein B9Q13_04745 [Candidatus Marsarchaeota G2 archaeon ECH_B_SAG-G16]
MTKYCTQCGHPNDDSAKFCASCGTSFSIQTAPPQPPTQGAQAYQQPRYRFESALSVFTKNFGLIAPMVIFFVVDLIISAIVLAVLFLVFLHGSLYSASFVALPLVLGGVTGVILNFVSYFLLGIFASILIVEARNAVSNTPYSFRSARKEVSSRLSEVLPLCVILGVIAALFSFLPFLGWLLKGLLLMYFVAIEGLMFTRASRASSAISDAASLLSEVLNQDALSFVVILVASLLSVVPILNIFTLPYVALVLLVYLSEKGATPSSPPQPPTPYVASPASA